jgi:hypothetical protein
MSTLQVANVHLESTGNNRIQYAGANVVNFYAGGSLALTLGTATNAASGYTILPNQLKMNWGSVVANSVGTNVVTYASAFTTNTYGLSLTVFGANAAVATVAKANTLTATGFTLVCGNTTALNNTNISSVYYMAIGPA